MSNTTDTHRPLERWERQLLLRLLGPSFPGRDELRNQVGSLRCSPIDQNGSLDLLPSSALLARVEKRVPTEGEAVDVDGVTIHYLLHVRDGKLKELEIYKDDSSRVQKHPEVEGVEVLVLG